MKLRRLLLGPATVVALVLGPLALAPPAHAGVPTVEHCFAGSATPATSLGPYLSNFGIVAQALCIFNGTDSTLNATCLQWSPDGGATWLWDGQPNDPTIAACDTNDLIPIQIAIGIKQGGVFAYRVVFGWSLHGVVQPNVYGPPTWY